MIITTLFVRKKINFALDLRNVEKSCYDVSIFYLKIRIGLDPLPGYHTSVQGIRFSIEEIFPCGGNSI